VIDKSKREDGTFSREDFSFYKEQNIYIRPAGKISHHDGQAAKRLQPISPTDDCDLTN
jgi:hypothetical protein